ncbi:family 16 glycosylhydrolase [Gilvimarinus agarilyticus]|uniref:glycoside hydrolase family 16 protein n=1 Tax=Gilvimarinus sp. 2_MG-2023 TaxID=3062666 RepID=UPI001C0A513A|nr:family 16 glycosylhydrolase [Gilvimarinus sp. 2_MG-2023]MBU2886378.1 family 16 glycosylhydrolase [Gilvimarinus agarilyticus]MDO6571057.1 family 16 glycosylhydrolase [Gilvimarinus sp. 2_MG-2023]
MKKSKNTTWLVCYLALGLSGCYNASLAVSDSSTVVAPYGDTPVSGYTLSWSDEFNGDYVNESKWHYRLDCKHWSQQKARNNSVSGGLYRIHLRQEASECPNNTALQPGQEEGDDPAGVVQYSGGGIISNKFFRYGFYEARLRVPPSAGWHSSFWMMRSGVTVEDDLVSHIELDPFENDSIDLQHYQTDAHQWKPEPGTEDPGRRQNKVGTRQIRFAEDTLLSDFHVIGMEFTDTHLRYFFDGALVSETAFAAEQFQHNDVNIWLTSIGTFLGPTPAIDNSQLPSEMQVDYVRFFQKTP